MPQAKSKQSIVIHERARSGCQAGSELRRKKSKASSGALEAMCTIGGVPSASQARTSSEGGCTVSASSCSAVAAAAAASSPAGHDSMLARFDNTVPAFPAGTDHSAGGSLHATEPSASGAANHLLKAPATAPALSPPPVPRASINNNGAVYNAGRDAAAPRLERKPSGTSACGRNMIRNNSFDSVNIHEGAQPSANMHSAFRESIITSDQQQPHYVASKLTCPAADVNDGSGSMHHTRITATAAAARPSTHFSTADMLQAQYSPGTDQLSTTSRGSGSSSAVQQLSGHASLSSGSCLGSGESEQQQQHCNAAENAHATDNGDAGSEPGAGGHDSLQMHAHTGIGCESLPGTTCACFHTNNGEQPQQLDGGHAKLGSEPPRQSAGASHDHMYNADVVQDQDSATAADWNDGFWIPVGNDEDDHMMHLMASSSGSSGSRMMHASGQAFAGADSADRGTSFLDSPVFPLQLPSSQGFYSSNSTSRSLPRTSISPAGDILSSCQMQSVPAAAEVADFCESLLNVDLNQQHQHQHQHQHQQLQGSSPMMMSSMMSDMCMSCNLDPMHYHHASSTSSSPERMINMDHHCNQSWMQNMDQWMDQGHSTQLSSSLVHHRDSPSVVVHQHSSPMSILGTACYTPQSAEQMPMSMQQQQSWSNYGNRAASNPSAPPQSYSNYGLSPLMTSLGLPAASDLMSGNPTGPYMQFGVGLTPTRSLSSSDMSGLHGFGIQHQQLHHQPGLANFPSYVHNSPMIRSLSTSALHSETDKAALGSSIRRHSPAIKRSLSFMQSTDEDAEGSSPSSSSAKASRLTNTSAGGPERQSTSPETSTAAADTTTPPGPVSGVKLGIGSSCSSNSTTVGPAAGDTKPAPGSTCFRPGIDDAAAQLSALLYTKSRTDIGNNAISQYHKLAFQNSFYNTNKLDNPSSTSCVSSGVGIGSKNAARRRHGTATDPQSIAARTRRERFSDRIRILQSLVPNGERLDTVSMLGQTLEYVRFLQQQVWQLYNGTSTPLSAHGAAGGASASAAAANNLAAQVASAESLAATFLSNMAQRQAAASAAAAPNTASRDPAAEATTKLAAGHVHGHNGHHPGGTVDKWKQLAGNGSGLAPHVPAECTPVA